MQNPLLSEDINRIRWESLLKEGEHLQQKIDALFSKWRLGLNWLPTDRQKLSTLMYQRQQIAQKIGLFVLGGIQHGLFVKPVFPDSEPQQLPLFSQTPLHWFQDVIQRLQAPKDLKDLNDIREDLKRIEGVVSNVFSWSDRPSPLQAALLTQIAARLRYIQEETEAQYLVDEAVRKIFNKMTDYSKKHTPGFVHGMSLNHKPKEGYWRIDARKSWLALNSLLAEQGESEKKIESLKALLIEPIDWQKLTAYLQQSQDIYTEGYFLRILSPYHKNIQAIEELNLLSEALEAFIAE